jgi:hypothetical protein
MGRVNNNPSNPPVSGINAPVRKKKGKNNILQQQTILILDYFLFAVQE